MQMAESTSGATTLTANPSRCWTRTRAALTPSRGIPQIRSVSPAQVTTGESGYGDRGEAAVVSTYVRAIFTQDVVHTCGIPIIHTLSFC
jgi:hypothetical protein